MNCYELINGRVVRSAIDDKLKGNENMCIKKLFKPAQYYSINEVKEGMKLGKFQSECHFAGENDLLIILPDMKLFLCVEIKRHMSSKETYEDAKSTSKIDRNMKSASCQ